MRELNSAMLRSVAAKYSAYAIQFASLMILSRIFSPETFGTVASIQAIYILFQIIAEAGFTPTVISLRTFPPITRDGVFGGLIFLGCSLGILFYLCTPIISAIYPNIEASRVVIFAAIGITFTTWAILPTAQLLRDQLFFKGSVATISSELISLIIIILSFSYTDATTSLGIRLALFPLINFLLLYAFSTNTEFGRPLARFKANQFLTFIRSSKNQLAFNVLNYFSRNLDNLLIGRYMGAGALGVYDRSYALMRYPLQLLTLAISPAIQPVLRNHTDNLELIEATHRKLVLQLSIMGLLCSQILYYYARDIVTLAFGNQWGDATPIIEILALTVPVQVVLSSSGSFFQTFERTDLMLRCGMFSAFTNVSAIVIGVMAGSIESVCWGLLISFHINFLQAYLTLYWAVFGRGFLKFLVTLIPSAAVIAATVLYRVY